MDTRQASFVSATHSRWHTKGAGATVSMSMNGRGASALPEEHYLSARTLHEAADVLFGLATVLDDVPGVWADDAEHDAQRLRDLAHALAGWWPRPASHTDGAAELDAPWGAVLALYLRRGLPH